MSVQQRPIDDVTPENLLIGMPFVEFSFLLSSGTFGPFFNLGIVDNAEIAKALEFVQLRSAQSGVDVLLRELVRSFDGTLNVGVFDFSARNMQLFFASAGLTLLSGGTTAVVGDTFELTDDPEDFLDLDNANLLETTETVSADLISGESVTENAPGSPFGETQGDFSLDFKILVVADVTSYVETSAGGVSVERVGDIVAGGAPMAGEIGIIEGAVATGGEITYPAGEGPAAGTQISVTYEPSFTGFVLNTDYTLDPKNGRIRFLSFNGALDEFKNFQPLELDYDFDAKVRGEIQPFTQFVFQGRARLRLLTDVGINILWTIPKSQVRLTDDAFAFSRDEFGVGALAINMLDNGGAAPFGNLETFSEPQANA